MNHLGLKEVAFTLDCAGSQLSDSLNERDRKRWAAEWTDIVKPMLYRKGDETAFDLLRQLCELDVQNTPFAITDCIEMTPEEEAAAAHRELLKFGEAGKAASERLKKRRRK